MARGPNGACAHGCQKNENITNYIKIKQCQCMEFKETLQDLLLIVQKKRAIGASQPQFKPIFYN